jgi:hypothetical protein
MSFISNATRNHIQTASPEKSIAKVRELRAIALANVLNDSE